MSILQHVIDANIAAFNNMLRHIQQRGIERTYNKRTKTWTPVVQYRTKGNSSVFLSYIYKENLRSFTAVIADNGVMFASPELCNISAKCNQRRLYSA